MECLGQDAEKYITFKVQLKKENEDDKLITCKLKFIDSIRFMDRSLSDITDNLSELNKQECNNKQQQIIQFNNTTERKVF